MPLFPNLIEKLQILRFSRRNRESELNPAVRTAFSRFLFEYAQRIAISAELLGAQRAMTEPPRRGPPTCPAQAGETVPCAHVLWGPISPEASRRAGSAFPTSSVLLRPELPPGVVHAATAVVPDEVLPRPEDTEHTLKARLAQSTFLEDIHVLKGGRGPARVRLNATSYPQPRRRSWSHVVEEHGADQQTDDTCASLLSYTAYGRLPSDWEAVAMPLPVEDLGVALWRVALPFLAKPSKRCPPTGCQLLLYYTLFCSAIGRHRDNYNSKQMVEVIKGKRSLASLVEGNHHGGDANSQVVGSNVLVYTAGDADMTFALSFPQPSDYSASREEYVIHPIFCTTLGAGTLLVFSPVDDLFFCHEAFFGDHKGNYRLAFVFRWLSQVRKFSTETGKMVLSPELAQAQLTKQQEKQQKRARATRALFKR